MKKTNHANPTANSHYRTWARKELGIGEDDDSARMRTNFLEHVEECDFLPPTASTQAWEVLQGQYLSLTLPRSSALDEADPTLAEEVEQFAADFFSLDLMQRQARYQLLLKRCLPLSPLRLRLKQLGRGLQIETDDIKRKNHTLAPLVGVLEELFVASPINRAAIMRRLRSMEESDPTALEQAATKLDKHCTSVAGLDRSAISYLLRNRIIAQAKKERAAAVKLQANPITGTNEGFLAVMAIIVAVVMVGLFGVLNPPQDDESESIRSKWSRSRQHEWKNSPDMQNSLARALQELEDVRKKYNNENIISATPTHIVESRNGVSHVRPKTEEELAIDREGEGVSEPILDDPRLESRLRRLELMQAAMRDDAISVQQFEERKAKLIEQALSRFDPPGTSNLFARPVLPQRYDE